MLPQSGYGTVIRDFKGHVIAAKSSSLTQCTNKKVEALALLFGLELAKSLSISKLHVEGDSSIIINTCIKIHVYNWSIQYTLHQAWSLLDSIYECYIMHTYKEGNLLANCLLIWVLTRFILTLFFPHLTSLIAPTWLIL